MGKKDEDVSIKRRKIKKEQPLKLMEREEEGEQGTNKIKGAQTRGQKT